MEPGAQEPDTTWAWSVANRRLYRYAVGGTLIERAALFSYSSKKTLRLRPRENALVARFRDAEEADFDTILAVNAAEVRHTSPMDASLLGALHRMASHHKVAVVEGRVVGFLLALREHAPYQNDNYAWFAARYPRFVYVDRIVIAVEFAGRKIGSALYRDLFAYARTSGVKFVTCEYGLDPPNPRSKAFHDRFGFEEVGVRRLDGGMKLVSMQAAVA